MKAPLIAAGVALFAGSAAAQVGVTDLGPGCAGLGGTVTPTLTLSTSVIAGQVTTVDINGPAFGVAGVYVTDCADVWAGIPLPLNLAALDPVVYAGCTLYVNIGSNLFLSFLDGNGDGSLSGTVTNVGNCFRLQAFTVDILNQDIVGVTNGLECVIQEAPPPAGGDLVINEVMQNPSSVFDDAGEWFELFNPGPNDVDIEGWTVKDDGSDSFVIASAAGSLVVPAGGYVVIGNNADTATNGGVQVDYAWGTDEMFLSNGSDELELLDAALNSIDRIAWDNGATFPDPNGSSMSLNVAFANVTDNDAGVNWSVFLCPIGGNPFNGDDGTPGAVNDVCTTGPPPTASGELIFSEVMNNPGGVSDNDGEWFEVYNTTGGAIDLNGYSFLSGAQSFTVDVPLVIPAGGYVAFLRMGDPLLNGGIDAGALGILSYDYPDAWNMSNSGATLQILDPSDQLIGELIYDDAFDVSGEAKQLPPGLLTQTDGETLTNWCIQTATYTDGTFIQTGTPGQANVTCP
jgi:hypothetical protein